MLPAQHRGVSAAAMRDYHGIQESRGAGKSVGYEVEYRELMG